MRVHPRNHGFIWRDVHGPFMTLAADEAAAWNRDGFFVRSGVFDPATLAGALAAIDPLEAQATEWLRARPGGRHFIARADEITFTTHLVARSPVLRELACHPVLAALAHDLLGPAVRLYWDQSVYKKPGNPAEFPWHQDNGYTYIEPQQYLTCWIALNDATIDNGAVWVVPGEHHAGTLAHWPTDLGMQCYGDDDAARVARAVAVPVRAGDVVVFSSLTPHRTGPNLTGTVRKAWIVQYAPDGAVAWRDGVASTQDDPERQYRIPPPAR